MRLRLRAAASLLIIAATTLLVLWPSVSRADDRMVVRGNYYREDSTRILAPSVTYHKDVPDERLTFGVDYLMDTISSASIGAAAAVRGGDKVFTEIRHESGASIGSKLGAWGLSTNFRYSSETDYRARAWGLGLSREFLQKTLTFSLNYSYTFDRVFRILNNLGERSQWKSSVLNDDGDPVQGPTNLLQVQYLNLGYGHVYGKYVLGGANVEVARATGPQDNPYRTARNGEAETHPLLRNRMAASTYLLWSIPRTKLVLEPRYRYYTDDWGIQAHSIDARVHLRVQRRLRIRARYRYYTQTGASFWQADGDYELDAPYKTADPKTWAFGSHTPGLQVTYEFDDLAQVRGFGWLAGAWIEGTYNHVFRRSDDGKLDPRYGNARMGSLAFSLGF